MKHKRPRPVRVPSFEEPHFLVDVVAFGRIGEARRINTADPSRAVMVCAASVPPASKSCRSRKTGRGVLGIGPIDVSRLMMSLSMRKPSSRECSRLAVLVSRWLQETNALYFKGTDVDMFSPNLIP